MTMGLGEGADALEDAFDTFGNKDRCRSKKSIRWIFSHQKL